MEDDEAIGGNSGVDDELQENLEQEDIDKIKLTDFGLAHFINPKTNKAYMKFRAGTQEYKAPEVKDVI
jgi:serine/threonine protein kinase